MPHAYQQTYGSENTPSPRPQQYSAQDMDHSGQKLADQLFVLRWAKHGTTQANPQGFSISHEVDLTTDHSGDMGRMAG